ncbi:hypothetical protein Syun_005112 [Stephania yunnanensis]|uniref:Uncharacterized protein n=1 Tax=Stephania yunnanensis TaxID=152371 RepID=A0AAP0L557_9MAGN
MTWRSVIGRGLCDDGVVAEDRHLSECDWLLAATRAVITIVKPVLEETILDLISSGVFLEFEVLGIADLGCSSGPNTLSVISHMVDTITMACQRLHCKPPEFQVFLNDLPGNDFNTIFKSLPSFYHNKLMGGNSNNRPCFIAGTAGSFYERLFPRKTLHFIHSSYSLHYLSQVPKGLENEEGALNKGNIYIASTTFPTVSRAYYEQFNHDFSSFLKSRSEEVLAGGRAILTFMGRRTEDPSCDENCTAWKMISLALNDIAQEGLIKEAQIDSFNLPYYAPSAAEVRRIILEEGSFNLIRLEAFEISWDANRDNIETDVSSLDSLRRAKYVTKCIRAVAEPMLSSCFGGSQVMNALFCRFTERVAQLYSKEEPKYYSLLITLRKI